MGSCSEDEHDEREQCSDWMNDENRSECRPRRERDVEAGLSISAQETG